MKSLDENIKVTLITVISIVSIVAVEIGIVMLFFHTNPFTATKVEKIFLSPDEQYQVELISYDEGALGGSTIVRLVEIGAQKEVSSVGEEPIGEGARVATGRWDDYKRMNVVWQDESSFQIIIEYDWTDKKNAMDVFIHSDGERTTSGWYKTSDLHKRTYDSFA